MFTSLLILLLGANPLSDRHTSTDTQPTVPVPGLQNLRELLARPAPRTSI